MAKKSVLVHTFLGSGKEGRYNAEPFLNAFEEVVLEFPEFEVTVDHSTIKSIKTKGMTMEAFGEWLARAQMYFITSHPGQGFSMYQGLGESNWSPWKLEEQAKVLKSYLGDRVGFPNEFDCGAFSQNKLTYKEAIKDLCVPFHRLVRTSDGELGPDERRKLFRFCAGHFEMPLVAGNCGWVLKIPFTTHNEGRFYCKSVFHILTQFKRICNNQHYAGLTTFFVEPRMSNRKEMKVVLAENDVTGEKMAPFFTKNHIRDEADFQAFHGDHDIFAFAEHAKAMYQAKLPGALVSPLIRVDVFETQCFIMKVNEFENLDANTPKSGQKNSTGQRCKPTTDSVLTAFKLRYWKDKIRQKIIAYKNSVSV